MTFKRKWGGGGISDVPEARPPGSELDPDKVQHVPATEKPYAAPPSDADATVDRLGALATEETRDTERDTDPDKVQHVPATEKPFDAVPAALSDADSAAAAELARSEQEAVEEAERRAQADGAELARNLVGEPMNDGAPDELASPSSPPLPQTQSVPMRITALQNPPPNVTQSTTKEADPLPYSPPTHVRVGGRGATVVQEFGPRRSRRVDGNPDDLPITNDPPSIAPIASANDPANLESKPSDDPLHNLAPRAADAPELATQRAAIEGVDHVVDGASFDVDPEMLTPIRPVDGE
jgi:hypothetical protein